MPAAPAAPAAAAYGTDFSPLPKADPPATQHTIARRKSGAQGGGNAKRSKFTPTSLLTQEEVVAKQLETTHKLHLSHKRENRAKATLQNTQARLAIEQQRRVVAEKELAEKTARTAWFDKVEKVMKAKQIHNYFPDLAKQYVDGDMDINGFAHLFTNNLAVNAVGSRGNSYDPALKEHLGILRDSHSPNELLERGRLASGRTASKHTLSAPRPSAKPSRTSPLRVSRPVTMMRLRATATLRAR